MPEPDYTRIGIIEQMNPNDGISTSKLENQSDIAVQLFPVLLQPSGRTDDHCHIAIMSASVHNSVIFGYVIPVYVGSCLSDSEGIHIGPECNCLPAGFTVNCGDYTGVGDFPDQYH